MTKDPGSVVGVLVGATSGSSLATRGTWQIYDSKRASVSQNVLTLKKAGNYKITFHSARVRGIGSSGSITITVRVLHNSTSVTSGTTITAAVSDTIQLQASTGSTYVVAGFTLYVEEVAAQ